MFTETIITGQNFLDDGIVAQKRAGRDYTVYVSPAFEVEGEMFRAILDGNHSMAAANADGVCPEFVEMTSSQDDRIALIGDVNLFLEAIWMDGEFINARTRVSAF